MPDDSPLLRVPGKSTGGTATSAHQIEGSWNSENRGESTWDTFCHQPRKSLGGDTVVAVADGVDRERRVRDTRRSNYLRDHLVQVHRAIADGTPVSGYFAWSLLDNFEWNYAYRIRSGLTYGDDLTQLCTIKDSGRWFAQVCKANGFDPQAPYVPATNLHTT